MAITKKGNISKIVGRAIRGGELCYQVLLLLFVITLEPKNE